MDLMEAVRARHSVRRYTDAPIEPAARAALENEIAACNAEGNLHIQLACNEPQAFSGPMGRYGSFTGVRNYIGLIGKRGAKLDETLGWYGERLVLLAQTLGLNTCWVALTYNKGKCPFTLEHGEALRCVIAVGYGATQGVAHKSKPVEALAELCADTPEWFLRGMESVLLAPTAINQQKFKFTRSGDSVSAKALPGPCVKFDLGIVKYHFALAAGTENFRWA